ncbi:MAG: 30S ribosomal protein S8 [Rickettsiaceae bacterium]|nr:30S ribosomal protein S8 [Rickettsiaceae bacterium]MDP4832298.1 30S ribosomal protein S8 [Rickettsiaceae bacterium]MDP5020247.1 30S ribosomal protein S8 [Rickettsiaceae bacterium]MDP5083136.1 30S ribosomal protein S8 [Rickettsiaceae bacterium]
MSMSDNIADMLTRIRNGQKSRLLNVGLPMSKLKCAVLDVLKNEGFIAGYTTNTEEKTIDIALKYSRVGQPAICEIHRVSKPGKRMYSSIGELPGYFNNMGIHILSTSHGVMSDREAKKLNVGGEVICKVF